MDSIATMAVGPDLSNATVNGRLAPYLDAWSGQSTGCWISYWRGWWPGYDIDTAVPHYRLASRESSVRSLAALNARNCAPFPYMNGVLWDSDIVYTPGAATGTPAHAMNEIWTANEAARYEPADMVKDVFGEVAAKAPGSSKKFVCQSSSRWKRTFVDACRTIAADGWKGIYYDQAAFVRPELCYDLSHAHEPGDPWVWQEGIRDVLTTLDADPQTRDLMIFTEGNAEIYMDLVDAYLAYAGTAMVDSEAPLNRQVPLFKEVYGEVARFIGWQIFPPSNPNKTAADLNPGILRDAVTKAANYGALLPSPYFSGFDQGGDDNEVQAAIARDPQYANLFNHLSNPHYKKVYERGAGALNWNKSGAVPDPVTVVEGGTAAVSFAIADGNNRGYYDLRLDEPELFHLSWDMKMSGRYSIRVTVTDTAGKLYDLLYDAQDRNLRQTEDATLRIGLGADTAEGEWRTVTRDLGDDLYQGTSSTLARVVNFRVQGSGLLDNISLSAAPRVYDDGSAASNWLASADGLSAGSIVDPDTESTVVEFNGIGSRDDDRYFGRGINDSERFELAWDFKTTMEYYVLVVVAAEDGRRYNLLYDQSARDFRQAGGDTVMFGLGADTSNGQWHSFRRNLADDLFDGTGRSITSVIHMRIYATGSLDNVSLWGNGLRSSGR